MFGKYIEQQTIALGALHQSCLIIENIAWNGEYSINNLETLINSILKIDSASIEDIYGEVFNLKNGFNHLRDELTNVSNNSETKKYFKSLINLSFSLDHRNEIINHIQDSIKKYNEYISINDPSTIEKSRKLSSLYINTLSKIEPRIVVTGDNKYLTVEDNASIIRTSLFAGLRAVYLWKQYGGNRLKLFFYKSQIKKQIDTYINN
ncbi:MAG: hypothetical protein CMD65_03075 [Gammaproteobacteria bacterium]|nr:hypothetical protein [Gammaproteobacteria bacterium]|tara:strand:- start:273 stop:890 length:618 start_codon:yes stop_codon:yes gene_type:complete